VPPGAPQASQRLRGFLVMHRLFYVRRKGLIMKFVDEATIIVEAGKGGHGCLSFRRENTCLKAAPMVAMVVTVALYSWKLTAL